MLTALRSTKAYHCHTLEQHLQQLLPTAAAVEIALAAVEQAVAVTQLPYQDIAEPYLHLVRSGWVGGPGQLLQLLALAQQLNMPFFAFVDRLRAARSGSAA
ncbi:hypothetical protein [Hymenobacter crusticola]|uniref:Uncharacterized protein n=1 Tax=Hymenobacter crusticola TaxID=1770526 RepID=A0A243W659_9BACT|nr:hypothetical protein [Hymenobacter crusticola]OUJ69492.1 hypothetical protein BXP70_26265 [Hymenobacter crusticola]